MLIIHDDLCSDDNVVSIVVIDIHVGYVRLTHIQFKHCTLRQADFTGILSRCSFVPFVDKFCMFGLGPGF